MEFIKFILFSCLCCLCVWPADAGSQHITAKPRSVPLSINGNMAAFVYINGTKYRLLQRYPDHWVLYDGQIFQAVHLLNQLVVSGKTSTMSFGKYLKDNNKMTVNEIAAGTYLLTGTMAELMQAEQQLKKVNGLKLEWQIRYLPLKPAADR
ncbi:hypothetical protein [Rheinheimera sp. F8]|uniref:hypothetical protein n=1 Tax=Rheinheimera sp. F8 TaxID=1763998 RepID=UPI000B0F627A|nr:hypothetical protein [Rheinheimera sp. F8]